MGTNVLVRRDAEERMGLHGIVLVTSVEKQRKGTVLATGPKVQELKEGDVIYLPKFPGIEVKSKGRVAELHQEEDIIAKYE